MDKVRQFWQSYLSAKGQYFHFRMITSVNLSGFLSSSNLICALIFSSFALGLLNSSIFNRVICPRHDNAKVKSFHVLLIHLLLSYVSFQLHLCWTGYMGSTQGRHTRLRARPKCCKQSLVCLDVWCEHFFVWSPGSVCLGGHILDMGSKLDHCWFQDPGIWHDQPPELRGWVNK